jgi:ATP/maltotriose-dependent transcriptional regulator MalT
MATTRMGDYEDAAKHLSHAAPSITGALLHSRYGLSYLHARGHHYLATNHAHAALADFLSCGELVRDWGLDLAELVPWRTGAAEAWLRLGNPDQAKLLLYEQLGRPGMAGSRVRGLALRLLAAASPVARAPEMLTEALELLESCGDRYEQARVLADLSRAHTRLGDERKARMVFRRAWHVAELCGARPLCGELLAANGEPRVPPAPTPPPADAQEYDTLTSSERRVASLAVMGCTNREIAEKLHVTASTVEQHLTRAYRKLNVKRRRDLPADLRIDAPPNRARN